MFQSEIGNTYFNYGSSTPDVDNRAYPWMDVDGLWWNYSGDASAWIRKNAYDASGPARLMWAGTTTQLKTFDGGRDETATSPLYMGPMWEVDAAGAGLFPVFVGAIGTSGNVAVGASVTDLAVSGADKVTLTTAQLPAHNHPLTAKVNLDINGASTRTIAGAGAEFTDSMNTDNTGGGESHNNLPPFYGIYLIKRTARAYYKKN